MTPDLPFVKLIPPLTGSEYTDLWTIEVESKKLADLGNYGIILSAKFLNWPFIAPASFNFVLSMLNPCNTTTIVKPTLTDMTTRVGDPQVF